MSIVEMSVRKRTKREQEAFDMGVEYGKRIAVKCGRWKGYGMGDYSCSLCMGIVSGNRYNFCPNCGCDMRGETHEAD